MGSVENAIEVYDGATLALQNMNTALARTGQRFDDAFSGGRFGAALNGLNMINVFIDKIETNIDHSTTTQKAFTQQVNNSTEAEAELLSHITSVDKVVTQIGKSMEKSNENQKNMLKLLDNSPSALDSFLEKAKSIGSVFMENGKKILGASDEMTRTSMRLGVINGELQDTKQLSQQVFEAAERSRTSYSDTAAMVSALGTTAKDAFTGNDELIAFTELMNKNYKIGGASAQEQAASMSQLVEAMAAGGIQGDEYQGIVQNAPLLAESIEDYMTNVQHAKGSMKDWAAEGQITADVIKAAMFRSSDAVEERFGKLPVTWEDVGISIKNNAQMAFQDVLEKISKVTQSDGFQTLKNNLIVGLQTIGVVASQLFDIVADIVNYFSANWENLSPLIYGVAAALALYAAVVTTTKAVSAISDVIKTVSTLSSVLLASPLTWIILIIVAIIAIIYAVVEAINHFKGESISATGIVFGAFMWLAALIGNIIIGAINGVIQNIWAHFVEPFLGIIEWVLNVANGGFDSFGGAVANLIGQIISWFLSLGMVVTKIIDAVFGVDWTSGLKELQDKVLSWGKNENALTIDRDAYQIDQRIDMTDAYDLGKTKGTELENSIKNRVKNPLANENDYTDMYDNIAVTADNTGKMAQEVNISDEDIKYLHDVAERDAINRFTTSEIKVDMVNNNSIKGTRDIDGIVEYLKNEVEVAMNHSAEGV